MQKLVISFLTAFALVVHAAPVSAEPIQVFGQDEAVVQTASQAAEASSGQQSVGDTASLTTPEPPELYAGAAVLMDADTGQVLYGKNLHQRMYPASLTKVATCLLAIEQADFSDLVTITSEMVDTVPRSSTHIALTYDEQLTMEQLVYAMMVESANDAANAVAVHLGGSIPGFVELLNRRAAELGADDTRFTNANGLPEDDHYTTAYDLGLFTREALTHPLFRSLAGTQYYEIPPTNKQTQTRRLNNRQYMFCLNDTYPGAFAGKTGWTEEAGNTLITIAERDGITLIAVVLKSNGAVDAEFIDSTKLLDYGYDNFHRVTIPKDRAQAQKVDGGTFALAEDMQVLLPNAVSADDLNLQFDLSNPEQAAVTLTAPQAASAFMELQVGRFSLAFTPDAVPASAPEPKSEPWLSKERLLFYGKWAGAILLVLVAALLIVRGIVRLRYRRRQRRMRARRLRSHQPEFVTRRTYQASGPVVDATRKDRPKNKITVIDQRKL